MNTYVASYLKDMNRQKVYNFIKNRGTTSKAEISKITGISSPTVIKIVNFMVEKGLVIETGEAETAIGRRPHMLQINTHMMYFIGFVLEGDFLSVGVVDVLGNVLYKNDIPVVPDYHYIIELIKGTLIEKALVEAKIPVEKLFGIGIALPAGYNKKENLIFNAPLINVKTEYSLMLDIEELERKYHAMVIVENDTNAQALGEYRNGNYHEKDDLLFISVGTGIGAGLILGGKLRRGSKYLCGEIANITFDLEYCYGHENTGWLEDAVGHRKIEKKFGIDVISSKDTVPKLRQIEICKYVAGTIAMCINNINACLDCENVVLGGKVVEMLNESLLEEINKYLKKLCDNYTQVRMESTEDVGIIGVTGLLIDKKIKEILMSTED